MLTLAMRRSSRDFTPVSGSDIGDDDENNEDVVLVGNSPTYQQVSQYQRQPRDPALVTTTTTSSVSGGADYSQRHRIVTTGRGEEFVDILQVQQLLLDNASVGSVSSVGVGAGVLGHLHRTATTEYPHVGLEAAVRGRMLLESCHATSPAVPTPSFRHYHHPPQTQPPLSSTPYHYANYVQQQQHHTSSVEDLFALWLGSSAAGRSFLF